MNNNQKIKQILEALLDAQGLTCLGGEIEDNNYMTA